MWSGIWSVATTTIGFWTCIWFTRHCRVGEEVTSLITLVLLMWKWVGLFLRKNLCLRYWDWLFLLNWIGALTLSIITFAKTASKKIGALIHSMNFLSSEVALYLHKSTIWACMESYCHVWAGTPSYYLELFDKLQKRNSRTGWLVHHLLPLLKPWLIVEV